MPWDDAQDVVSILAATGRTVPMARWVEHFVLKARDARAARLPHNLV